MPQDNYFVSFWFKKKDTSEGYESGSFYVPDPIRTIEEIKHIADLICSAKRYSSVVILHIQKLPI